jgi:flavin-dependent dehydrogenase
VTTVNNTPTTQVVDAVVLGAGIAGSTAASILARNGINVLMIDGKAARRFHLGEHLAPYALPTILNTGISQELLYSTHLPSPGVLSCWGSDTPANKDYFLSPFKTGLNLNRAVLNNQFREMAISCGSGFSCARATNLAIDRQNIYTLELDDGTHKYLVSCKGIIDSTGRSRYLPRRSQTAIQSLNSLVAIASWYTAKADNTPALSWMLLEAAEYGWWYSLLVPDSRLVVVLICDQGFINRSHQERNSLLNDLLRYAPYTHERIQQTQGLLHRSVKLCSTSYLERASGHGWIAIGDAAATFDPILGSGITHAIQSADAGAHAFMKFLDGDQDALVSYSDAEHKTIRLYLQRQFQAYQLEQRWPSSRFWASAHSMEC